MKINLWQPGEPRYKSVEFNIGDKILLKTWKAEIIGGIVLEITENDELKLHVEDVLSFDRYKYEEKMDYFFDLTDAYGIDVIMTAEEMWKIRKSVHRSYFQELLKEFNDKFNILSDDALSDEDFDKLLDTYTSSIENKKFYDNVFESSVKQSLYEILSKLEENYVHDKTMINRIINGKKDIKG